MTDEKNHWERVYRAKAATDVSWYQPSLKVSLELVSNMGLAKDARIIDVGGGASTFVDDLLAAGFDDITVLDISSAALDAARVRLAARAADVTWIEADITTAALPEDRYDLWHDRAVFHFLTRDADRRAYVRQVERALRADGHIVVATFGLEGPEKCSGLEVARYDADGLHREFGSTFVKVAHAQERHTTPWGAEQEFVYCYCRHLK